MAGRVFGPLVITPKYVEYTHFPWEAVELAAGLAFNDETRRDIFDVWQWYELALAHRDHSFTVAEIEQFRKKMIQTCFQMHSEGIGAGNVDLFDALCWYVGRDVRDALFKASKAAKEALGKLSPPPDSFAIVKDIRSREAMALREALKLMRQPVGRTGQMRAQTWGLKPVRRSPRFRRFLSAFCDREISADDLANALKAIRKSQAKE